ncbi:MAG: GNAT family N-acetyltransferase [Bacteroidales bacterium]
MEKIKNNLVFRSTLINGDKDVISDIVTSTGFFNVEEVSVAVELAVETLSSGQKSGYNFIFAELDGKVAGYCCFGRIPGTKNSFDLYWIVVHCDYQRSGIGAALLKNVEDFINTSGGGRIYIETSSRKQYEPTRDFYIRSGYFQEALLTGFYDDLDHKIIYSKNI